MQPGELHFDHRSHTQITVSAAERDRRSATEKGHLQTKIIYRLRCRMDLQEYFQRIGFSGPFEKPDLATLQLVHRLHVLSIPFENLSLHSGQQNSMELPLVFNKLVRQRRGGWCCESNLLFSWALGQMGYAHTMLGARVHQPQQQDFSAREGHLINRVDVAGRSYITDVSFGVSCQIWEPLELTSGKEQPQAAGMFRLKEDHATWVLEKTSRTPLVPNEAFATSSLVDRSRTRVIYCFTLEPRRPEDFHAAAQFYQTAPDSLFTNKSICSLQTPTGFRALIGWVYSEVTFGYQEEFDLMEMRNITDAEVQDVLREKFGMPPVHNLKLKSEKVCYSL
ncbi:arylamine N-acetyltransferase, pineal gland isozyme NAT-3-like isoform X1 [Alosa sapidissima]|uniref:arylamine N-acetyltransferase, pineal gland isozyme NAT-3-like isoform X1 n=2 Tax=Alosa sapidissima TaxID=34773 RepID=UPI001C090008|nr:arylamine N-acetyltransferase, pineal gland isozyme NAT-3-like isoform X1 [Alosa sapidissima]